VNKIVDVTIDTDGNYGYGIEPQAGGDIELIRRVIINTTGANSHGIGAWVNDGAHMAAIFDTTITTRGSNAHGLIIGDVSSVQRMERVTIRRSASASDPATAILVESDGTFNYFNTPQIKDNVICTLAGGIPWTSLLADDDVPYTGATVPHVLGVGPYGAQTFPWGDADDVNQEGDGGQSWNLQTQWGGACP
jgi:predicted component of type VI protein secretion system